MSRNPTAKEVEAMRQAEVKARLLAKNKELARQHLLQIQLMLAKRPINP